MARSKASPKPQASAVPQKHWTVQRSGAGLSVAITDAHGHILRKLSSVERIAATPEGRVIAYFSSGQMLDLAQA